MNILLIGNHFQDKKHNQNAWQDLAVRLRSSGHTVNTTSGHTNKLPRLLDMLWSIWRWQGAYDLAQIDVFSGPAFFWAYLSGCLLNLLRKPFVLTLHGGNLPSFSQRYSRPVRWLLNKANRVTAPSSYLRKEMQDFRHDIMLLPNALEVSPYTYKKRSTPQPKLIWLRAFHSIYNPELAIKVVFELMKAIPEIELIMVGPDKGDGSLQSVQALAAELGVVGRVQFAGRVDKGAVPDWLNRADIFINTTNFDNTPISVMEAMACGLCIVSTNVGGVPYLIDDGENGLLVPPDEAQAMTEAVRRILTEPGLAEKLSTNARKKAEQFDWSVILPQWEELLEKVANRGK